jgi:hypothetical protein
MMKNRNKEEERRWVLHTYIFTLLHMVCHKWRINGKKKKNFGQPPSPTAAVKPASLTTGNNPAPTPSPVSHCLQGGLQVLAAYDNVGEH